ncbi:phage tail protein, partial [Martelella mangrovi]
RPLDALEELRLACNALLAEVGGIFKVQVGAPGSAVYAFTDDDIIITKGQSLAPHGTLDDTTNAVEATYPEPAEKWTMKDAPARYDSALELADGNRRLPESFSFEACPYGGQVQRLMQAMLKDARRFRTHQFFLPPDAWPLEPNDVVSWTSARNGYDNKKFLVVGISTTPGVNAAVSLKEIDPSDYDWSAADALPTAVGWLGKIGVPAQVMTGWNVQPATLHDAEGNAWRPTIRVGWAGGLDDVERVWVQVRQAANGDVVFDSDSMRYASPYYALLQPVFRHNTDYEVRGRYIPISRRPTEWSAWLSVTTPDVATDLDVTLDTVGEDVRKRFEELQADFNLAQMRLADLAASVSLQGSVGLLDRLELRQQAGEALAQIIEERLVRATEDEALAQRTLLLGAELDDATAALVQEQIARATADAALAEQTNTLTAQLGDAFAAGQVKFSVAADQSGVDARFSVLIRAGTGGAFRESGFYLEVYTEGGIQRSRFAVNADQFVVLNNGQRPLVFEGGTLKLNVADIGTVRAGYMESLNNKMIVDLNAGRIIIRS